MEKTIVVLGLRALRACRSAFLCSSSSSSWLLSRFLLGWRTEIPLEMVKTILSSEPLGIKCSLFKIKIHGLVVVSLWCFGIMDFDLELGIPQKWLNTYTDIIFGILWCRVGRPFPRVELVAAVLKTVVLMIAMCFSWTCSCAVWSLPNYVAWHVAN